MYVEREFPTEEAAELIGLTRELVAAELTPRAAAYEEAGRFPREVFTTLGRSGLLGLPYPEEYGGGGQPYEVYLQVIEELAAGWLAVGLGVSVHTLACFPIAHTGTERQRAERLTEAIGGELLGAYCLSEPDSGSDAAAMTTRAVPDGDGYTLTGTKAWITHGGVADFYTVFARADQDGTDQAPSEQVQVRSEPSGADRTDQALAAQSRTETAGGSRSRSRGITCFHVRAQAAGLVAATPENKMGMRSSPTAQIRLDQVAVPADDVVGVVGDGFGIALAALDGGRLGIAACGVGLAQAALDLAVGYATERRQFGRPIADFQGLSFMLADMATGVAAARALYLSAARLRDAGRPYGAQAAMAKLFATDTAMRVTTDAVQILGGYGYVSDFPAERYMREAKVLQIVEGTNQIQRMVIGRGLTSRR